MDGEMKRGLLTSILALVICGCAGRMNTDLLQARIREQASQLSETQREITKTRSELKQSRLEAERLKAELALTGNTGETTTPPIGQITRIRINPLASGGINKDEFPGDDAVVVQFVPLDVDNEPIKIAGESEIVLIDPLLDESDHELGRWTFSSEECLNHWTRGIASSGFQFNLPLKKSPQHTDLVVQLKFKTNDSRQHHTTQVVKVAVAKGTATAGLPQTRKKPVQVVEEPDELLPPVGDTSSDADLDDWTREDSNARPSTTGRVILESSSWTEATIPRFR